MSETLDIEGFQTNVMYDLSKIEMNIKYSEFIENTGDSGVYSSLLFCTKLTKIRGS